jgi:putative membrane protein
VRRAMITETDRYFGEAARARVAVAVRQAEALSRGQIVPVVVEKSDPYAEARYRGGLLAAAVATGIALAAPYPLTLAELAAIQLAAGILGWLIAAWDPVERLLAGARTQDQAVHARAARAFQEHGLARTGEGTGVLIFASLFERHAVILGDHGIHAKMKDATKDEWEVAMAALTAGMKAGDPARGFVDAIALCGARLAEHFPRDPASKPPANELEDAIRVERG